MPKSTAVSAQKTKIFVAGVSGAALNITAVSLAAAAVFSCVAHAQAVGAVLRLSSIVGMEDLVDTLVVVTAVTADTFTTSLNTASNYSTPGTLGTATPQTWVKVGNAKDFSGMDGSTAEIDVTNFDSDAMEYRPGLADNGQFTFNVDLSDADAGQLRLRYLRENRITSATKLVYSNGGVRVFDGFVKKIGEAGAVNGILKSAVDMRITGPVTYGTVGVVAGGPDLRPRLAIGSATAGAVAGTVAALFNSAVPFGVSGSKTGSTSITTTAANYGWVWVLASACPTGVRFFDGVGYGGWSGATSAGNNAGATFDPSGGGAAAPLNNTVTYTDASANVWRGFRQDYANANPTPGSFTIS